MYQNGTYCSTGGSIAAGRASHARHVGSEKPEKEANHKSSRIAGVNIRTTTLRHTSRAVSNPKKIGEPMTQIWVEQPHTREKLKPQYEWRLQHVGSFFNTHTTRQFMNHPTVRTSTPIGSSHDIKRILNTSIALPHLPVSINGNSAWRLFQGALWIRTVWIAERAQRRGKIRSSKCSSYPNSPTLILLQSLTTISFTWIDFSIAGIGTKIQTDDQGNLARFQEQKRVSSPIKIFRSHLRRQELVLPW
jgi:hypothetical protein